MSARVMNRLYNCTFLRTPHKQTRNEVVCLHVLSSTGIGVTTLSFMAAWSVDSAKS
jgi:hypothetical protein